MEKKLVGRPISQFAFGYEDILQLIEPGKIALYKQVQRGELNPHNLASVVLFVARFGTAEVKADIFTAMTDRRRDKKWREKKPASVK